MLEVAEPGGEWKYFSQRDTRTFLPCFVSLVVYRAYEHVHVLRSIAFLHLCEHYWITPAIRGQIESKYIRVYIIFPN